MSQKNQQRGGPGRLDNQQQMNTESQSGKLTSGKKALLTFMIVIPCIFLFFYATGMWDVSIVDGIAIRDDLDDIATAIAICIGIFAVIIVNLFL